MQDADDSKREAHELIRELMYLEHKCNSVHSFGGAMARMGIWRPRIEAIEAELKRRANESK